MNDVVIRCKHCNCELSRVPTQAPRAALSDDDVYTNIDGACLPCEKRVRDEAAAWFASWCQPVMIFKPPPGLLMLHNISLDYGGDDE